MMKFDFSSRARKEIRRINEPDKTRLLNAIYNLPNGDVRLLAGYAGLYRLRIGAWRVVFSYCAANIILIEKVAPRGQIYKGGMKK
jgi:mRNA interferase RelE/StbE